MKMGGDTLSRASHLTIWQLLDLLDADLERVDVVEMNLAVARGISPLSDLDVGRYIRVVDEWTAQFADWLRGAEQRFHKTPECWKNDIRFFRIGMLAGYMGKYLGLGYIPEQRHLDAIWYTNPSDLFLNGLIDTKRGTCGSMPVLHVAIARRLGWPVALACVHSHFVSRYDDGEVVYNIEATDVDRGVFAEGPDDFYLQKYKLPRKAITSGSDLRSLTARETLGVFVALRGRHYSDTNPAAKADSEFALARHLFPQYRWAYKRAMVHTVWRGGKLFEDSEVGHPVSLVRDLIPAFAPSIANVTGIGPELGLPGSPKLPAQVLSAKGIYTTKVPLSAIHFG